MPSVAQIERTETRSVSPEHALPADAQAPVAAGRGPVPAGRKEEALWLLEHVVPGTGVNNLSLTFEVDGRLDPAALRQALAFLLRRHEVLRTVFHSDGSALTRAVLAAEDVEVALTEAGLPADGAESEQALTDYLGAPFALDGSPLLRARLFHGEQDDLLCVALHHLIFDTISSTTLFIELATAYAALVEGADPAEALPGTVPAASEIEPTDRSRRFWTKQLKDFDRVQPRLWLGQEAGAADGLPGATVTRTLSAPAVEVVRRLQQELRAPEAAVLLAGYYALLARHGAGPDIVVGSPVNSRRPEQPEAIGYHVNVVPLRAQVDLAQGFGKLVRQARSTFINSISAADVPVDSLLLEVERGGSGGWRNTLFQHVFNYVPLAEVTEFPFAGHTAKFRTVENGFSKFDLEFFILPSEDGIRIRTAYHTGAFAAEEVEALIERYDALLVAAGADLELPVGELPLFSAADLAAVERAHAAAAATGTAVDVLSAVAEQVRTAPDATAVEQGERAVTYAELWAAAVRTAERLAAAGIGTGDVVAVAASRGPELAAAALGSWLAGAAYLPVDPEHPRQRIEYQLTDSGARAALYAEGVELPAGEGVELLPMTAVGEVSAEPVAALPAPVEPGRLAYLIYTSGSTGLPKGTLLTHGNLANLVEHFRTELGAEPGRGVLWLTTFTFDISALELFLPLVSGGRLVVAPDEARTDGAVLAGLIERHQVTTVQATPTSWRLVLEQAGPLLAGRDVLCGGESLTPQLARLLTATGARVRNVYGPTETTIWSTAGLLAADADAVTVGRPIRQTRVFVADPDGRELPPLVPGELCIAGTGVADGYHRRPELTADRFAEHPVHGRFYRTGDRARWLTDGTLEVLGRADRQIKLRGVRIELGELEQVLAEHPAVRAAAVVLAGGSDGTGGTLVAFVEAADDAAAELTDELWAFAAERLPRTAVPQDFELLSALPTNVSQKVDYPALTRRAEERLAAAPATAAPTATEPAADAAGQGDDLLGRLVGVWQEVLNRTDVDSGTNFFTNGGNSLLGVKLVQRIEEVSDVHVKLADMFSHPTPLAIASLARDRAAAATK